MSKYWSPTPLRMRRLGDAILAAGTTITGFAIAEETKWLAMTSLILTVLGKFLTNFYSGEGNS